MLGNATHCNNLGIPKFFCALGNFSGNEADNGPGRAGGAADAQLHRAATIVVTT